MEKNTEVSLKRKREKREKEYRPPVEKTAEVKQKPTEGNLLIRINPNLFISFFLDTSKLVKNVKKKLKRLQA